MIPNPALPQDAWWADAIEELGHLLGFEKLTKSNDSLHNFSIEGKNLMLDIECYDSVVVMALFCPVQYDKVIISCKALLKACGFDKYLSYVVYPGLKDSEALVVSVKFNRNTVHEMAPAFEVLCQIYEDIEKEVK